MRCVRCGLEVGGAMTLTAEAQQLHDLSRAVRRLRPDWQHPERYFEQRSEIAAQMTAIALRMENDR